MYVLYLYNPCVDVMARVFMHICARLIVLSFSYSLSLSLSLSQNDVSPSFFLACFLSFERKYMHLKVLKKPLEITVGGKSVVCDDVEQHVEVEYMPIFIFLP